MDNRYEEKFIEVRDAVIRGVFKKASEYDQQPKVKPPAIPSSTRFRRHLSLIQYLPTTLHTELSDAYVVLLRQILKDISSNSSDHLLVLALLAEFYETDERVFGDCEDTDGTFADIYIRDAKDLFLTHAFECSDKQEILIPLLRICKDDAYGVRSSIFNSVGQFLEEEQIRTLLKEVQDWADKEEDKEKEYTYTYMINCFARQVDDIDLFEKTLALMQKQIEAMV